MISPAQQCVNRLSKYLAFVFSLASAGILLFAFRSALGDLWQSWQTDEYGHGLLIPFIAAFLAAHRLSAFKPLAMPSWSGVFLLAFSLALLVLGDLLAFFAVQQISLILALFGFALAFWGTKAVKTMAPALILLFFAIPLPNLVEVNLTQQLKLVSSVIGSGIVDLLGIPVYREGNIIDLGAYRLQVADACSGLRYIFPLMSLGYLIAYFYEGRFWQRTVLFLSAVPIAVLMNALRIGIIGITVHFWGIQMAEGVTHQLEGWVVFMACVLLLMAEIKALQAMGFSGHFDFNLMSLPKRPFFSFYAKRAAPGIAAVVILGIFVVAQISGALGYRKEIIPPHAPFSLFPLVLGDWRGEQNTLDALTLDSLKASDYWLASYAHPSHSASVDLFVAYYDSQRAGAMTHTPASCLPSSGWAFDKKSVKTFLISEGASLNVSRVVARKGEEMLLVYYWFDQRGRRMTEAYLVKPYLLIDSLKLNRTDGALIRAITLLNKNESEAEADQRLESFLSVAYPKIQSFLPPGAFP